MTSAHQGFPGLVAIALTTLLLAACSQEGADWKQASAANTIEAYQSFLQQHPQGAEATQAQTRLQQLTEQRDWQIASSTDTRDAYDHFVAQHPNSQWAQEARLRSENFAQAAVDSSSPGTTSAASTGTSPSAPATDATVASTPTREATAASTRAHRTATRGVASHRALRPATRLARAGSRSSARPGAPTRVVQLGAFKTREGARSQWHTLQTHFTVLRSLTPRYVAVRSHRGTVYRLQVQVSSSAAAQGLCASLKRHARSCVRINA